AEVDLAVGLGRVQGDAPAVVGHLHVAELRPATRVDADRGAQVDVEVARVVRPHVLPPVEEAGLPVLERTLQRAVLDQVDVVGNLVAVVDRAHVFALEMLRIQTRFQSKAAVSPWPYNFSAPFSPTALGRLKIQFCQAVRRPKMRVSIDSRPAKRRFASMPVSASGDIAARSSIAMRISSAQSMSSSAAVTRPSCSARSPSSGSPIA